MLKAGQRIPLRTMTPNHLFEAEKMKFLPSTLSCKVQDMTDFGPEWSGGKQMVIDPGPIGAFSWIIPDLKENNYDIRIFYTKGPDYGNFSVLMNDKPIATINAYYPTIYPGGSVAILGIRNPGNRLELKFKMAGKDPSSTGYKVGLDGISIEPKRKWIPNWYVTGPFPNPGRSESERKGIDSIYTPEFVIDLHTGYTGKNGQALKWKYVETPENGYIDLTKLIIPSERAVAYAVTYLFASKSEQVSLLLGTDDGAKVFFNNRQVYRYFGIRGADPDLEEIPLDVRLGWNKLLVKVENNLGGFGFYGRLLDRDSSIYISADQKFPIITQKIQNRKK